MGNSGHRRNRKTTVVGSGIGSGIERITIGSRRSISNRHIISRRLLLIDEWLVGIDFAAGFLYSLYGGGHDNLYCSARTVGV